jgi:hypothetical protein
MQSMGGRGHALDQCRPDRFQYPITQIDDIVVPEPQHSEPLFSQGRCPSFIIVALVNVLASVQLDD